MRINHKVLSIPPYLSTSWKNIVSLQSSQANDKTSLTIQLLDGSCVQIPEINPEIVTIIFNSHAKHIEQEATSTQSPAPSTQAQIPQLAFLELETIQSMLHHKEEERNSPNLPEPLLNKVSELSKEIGFSELGHLPTPEPSCNCPHCQIAKVIRKTFLTAPSILEEEEEEILASDLSFRSWIIKPLHKNLYQVSHPDEQSKIYQVTLESPIECSCGSNQCEHILAVLNS